MFLLLNSSGGSVVALHVLLTALLATAKVELCMPKVGTEPALLGPRIWRSFHVLNASGGTVVVALLATATASNSQGTTAHAQRYAEGA
jgi:hypothetical protein